MAQLLRHRQTKGPGTDKLRLWWKEPVLYSTPSPPRLLLADPSRPEGGHGRFEEVSREFAELDARLAELFERWEELELKKEEAD